MRSRVVGIDAFRYLAAIGVLFIHGGAYNTFPQIASIQINLAGRWAVPFFFLVSGYFIANKVLNEPKKVAIQSAKVAWVLAVASLAMIPLLLIEYGIRGTALRLSSMNIFTEGSYYHLWFLSSLAFSLFFFYAIRIFELDRLATLIIFGCFTILVLDAYFPTGRPIPLFSRYLMSIAFVYIGMRIRWSEVNLSARTSIAIAFAGCAMQTCESLFLWKWFGKSPVSYDFLLGTIPFSVGLFYLSLSIKKSSVISALSSCGARYSLGLYVLHPYSIVIIHKLWMWDKLYYDLFIVPICLGMTMVFLVVLFKSFPAFERALAGDISQPGRFGRMCLLPKAMPRNLIRQKDD